MKGLYFYLAVILLPLHMSAQSTTRMVEQPHIRQMSRGFDIAAVHITDTATVVVATFCNTVYRSGGSVSTAPPTANNAFRLIADKLYPLRRAEGIPYSPETSSIGYADTIQFVLYFDPIPAHTISIDLVEGGEGGSNPWRAYGIQLRKNPLQTANDFETYFDDNQIKLSEIEGFWRLDGRFQNKSATKVHNVFRELRIAIILERNKFLVYNVETGEQLALYFEYYKKGKFVFVLPVPSTHYLVKTFRYIHNHQNIHLHLKLSKKQVRRLELSQYFDGRRERIYWDVQFKYLGRKI